jgi:hypothetical protein
VSKQPKTNAMQAMLDRSKQQAEAAPAKDPAAKPARTRERGVTKFVGGYFPVAVSSQLRIIAGEENTTVQALIAEAIDDLFLKKAKTRIADL